MCWTKLQKQVICLAFLLLSFRSALGDSDRDVSCGGDEGLCPRGDEASLPQRAQWNGNWVLLQLSTVTGPPGEQQRSRRQLPADAGGTEGAATARQLAADAAGTEGRAKERQVPADAGGTEGTATARRLAADAAGTEGRANQRTEDVEDMSAEEPKDLSQSAAPSGKGKKKESNAEEEEENKKNEEEEDKTTTTVDPRVDRADMRITAYWDLEECGPMGDDYNRDWCSIKEEGAMFCQQTVKVNSSWCPSGYASLRALLGNGSSTTPITLDGCDYGFFAQYSCSEAGRNLDWSEEHKNVMRISRSSWMYRKHNPIERGFMDFVGSAERFEWGLFGLTLPAMIIAHWYFWDWPNKSQYHAVALIGWFGLGLLYFLIIHAQVGHEKGIMWLSGYMLEVIFSIENLFVFHIIVKVFHAPRKNNETAMTCVLVFQILLQLVCHLGLAAQLRTIRFLPYLLGLWLIYVGVQASIEDANHTAEYRELLGFRVFQYVTKGRIKEVFTDEPKFLVTEDGEQYSWRFTLLAPMVLCLVVADFLLEIDVTLTKIEEIPNQYIAFTSSVLATFALPELFFIARDLFNRFGLIKYGVCFVLLFFGVQMLCNRWFSIPDLASVGIILGVMAICIVASLLVKDAGGKSGTENSQTDTEHKAEANAKDAPSKSS